MMSLMARTKLLDTGTVNFAELIGNGKSLSVPPFQRDYSWSEEQWEDLWSDLEELRQDPESSHYMGSLVVESKSDHLFFIIDGQQRIATLSILILAVIKLLQELPGTSSDKEDNEERAKNLRNSYIGQKDPVSLIESSRLSLNKTDDDFYRDNLVSLRPPLNPRALPHSNALLWQCFLWFSKKLEQDPKLSTSGQQLAKLVSEIVARKLLFIQIKVDDETNAYTVFETLNARGLELSATDLLKNYLFSRIASSSDLEALERRWRKLLATVRQERFPEFLRYHLLCEFRQVRQQHLFKLIRNRVRTPEEVFQLIQALEARAELFSALFDVTHAYWIDKSDCKPLIRQLQLFGTRQFTPLAFAAWEHFDSADFARVLKLLVAITFRFSVVGARNTNELEPAYHLAAKAVIDHEATTPRQVFDSLRSIYIPDQKFREDFTLLSKRTQGTSRKIVKYILCALESDLRNAPLDFETDPATIEHILPENPSVEWDADFTPDSLDSWVYRIGNLTLLEGNRNREVGNSNYSNKLVAYADSHYTLTREIGEHAPEEWTPAMLEARQSRLASRAVHLWRSDFAS